MYRMTVHLFGATSSPGCANYGLKATADLYEEEFGSDAADFIRNDFYVDDGLKSVSTIDEAKDLIERTIKLCQKTGFRLHKFLSNKKEVLSSIPSEDRAKDIKDFDTEKETLPIERALGVQWCVENDTLRFRIQLQDRPLTRRGILSTVSSLFDPLGLVSPFILIGKKIQQELCKEGTDWDEGVSDDIRQRWEKWRTELILLSDLQIQRSFKPESFGDIKSVELHHFSDACLTGYGQCSYLKLIDVTNQVHSTLVLAKSRVSPSKPVTIPRLELTAAVVSVKVATILKKELRYESITEYFWTDSQVVLGYISNDAKRFHIYVANRVQQIRSSSSPSQWKYIKGSENPADLASRGLCASDLVNSERWWKGPEFLWSNKVAIDVEEYGVVDLNDPELKKVVTLKTKTEEFPSLTKRFAKFSDWHKLKLAISVCLRLQISFKKNLKDTVDEHMYQNGVFKMSTVDQLQRAETQILKEVQREYFSAEFVVLNAIRSEANSNERHHKKEWKAKLKESSTLYKLDPFLDEDGIISVGGRIQIAEMSSDYKHPVIIPKCSHVTELIIQYYHMKSMHQGRGITHNTIRASGYWIINGRTVISNCISKCVPCKKVRGNTQEQKMCSLPKDRLEPAAPFTYSAVDYFGPWYVKEGRRELKRYGVIFTCMSSRAIHLEVANTMDTDSFLNAYRRFVCRRGPVRQLRSDRGSNFIGAQAELTKALKEMDNGKVSKELLKDACDWISFKMNVPESSHMGGSWERLIRSVRNVLVALLHNHGTIMDDETLRTFMTEAESIVNSRPLAVNDINDPHYPDPITPKHILTMKGQIILPPPGVFVHEDLYVKRRWRRVQFLANEFWKRWSADYVQNLQTRQKWIQPHTNI